MYTTFSGRIKQTTSRPINYYTAQRPRWSCLVDLIALLIILSVPAGLLWMAWYALAHGL